MAFEPSDVAARICLNTADSATAAESMRVCRDLVTETDPLTVEFEKADPAGGRTGFLVEMLVRLPRVAAGSPEQTLLASVRPVIERLGLDVGKFTFDDPSTTPGPSGDVQASREEEKRTTCGAYSLYARIGADPFDEEGTGPFGDYPGEGDDLTVDPDDVPRFSAEQVSEMQEAVEFSTGLHVSLVTEATGLEPGRLHGITEDLAERIRTALPGPGVRMRVADHVSDDPAGTAAGALVGPVKPDPETPEVALSRARTAVQGVLGEHGWEEGPQQAGGDGRGSLATAVWRATGSSPHGLVRLQVFAGTGWDLFETVQPTAE